ncbi:MAG: hypothetical protein ACRDRK_23350 [Pseudonocardia sp.]
MEREVIPESMWRSFAGRLVGQLVRDGDLTDHGWAAAMLRVPRHDFIPAHHILDPGGWH